MKHNYARFIGLTALLSLSASINAEPIDKKNIQVMGKIAADAAFRPHQSGFPAPIRQNLVSHIENSLNQKSPITLFGTPAKWQPLSKVKSLTEPGIQVLKVELSTDRFTTGTLELKGIKTASVYLNGQLITGSDNSFDLTLLNAEHRLLVVSEQVDNWKKVELDWQSKNEQAQVTFHAQTPKKRLSGVQMYDAQTKTAVSISPDGKHMTWTKRHYSEATGDSATYVTELLNVKSQKVIYRWQGMTPRTLRWSPDNQYISFSKDNNLHLLDRHNFNLKTIAKELKGASGYQWLNEDTVIFNWNRTDESTHKFAKRYRALEDRWTGWRNNSQVYQLDINSGFIIQLTDGKLSHSLVDVDNKNKRILVSRSPVDYKEPPHYMTELVEVDLATTAQTVISKHRNLNSARYAKKGFYITAGPDFANGIGLNLPKGFDANNYEGQLFYQSRDGKVKALSKNFDPAINSIRMLANGNLLLAATAQDREQLYYYDTKRGKYKLLDTQLDVVRGYSVSKQSKPTIVYRGTTATHPQKVFIKTGTKKSKLLDDSKRKQYANVAFNQVKDWDFTNKHGEQIDGRYYLPPNFDENKKYPAIVFYYGGTVPTGRSFTGRWPPNLWAAQGYVVYVLQPAGAIGYGQKFAAKHVNGWGKQNAEDIIEGTKAFLKAHPFVDSKRVGNMGASYGGYMTMYLATQTDIFAASISHAGISNISEYWGYGWWGYAYSGIATKGSFPWNATELYTKQSPLFQADQITTPLLLLHGDSDTNVPPTESHQMYTALKILGKDVEYVEYAGDDHHINAREHRLHWWNTIMAYMDKKLKGQPQWWDNMYPKP